MVSRMVTETFDATLSRGRDQDALRTIGRLACIPEPRVAILHGQTSFASAAGTSAESFNTDYTPWILALV